MPPLIVVAALLILTGCSGPSGDSGEPGGGTRATAGPESEDLLLHGELTRDGAPVADGHVWVSVMADATDAEVGDVIPTWESTVVSSDDHGRFAVAVDGGELTSDFFNGDFLNYEINVVHDNDWARWNTTAHLVGEGVWRTEEDSVVGDPVAEASFDLSAPILTLTDSDGDSETSELSVVSDVGELVLPEES
jgi:hypothetical protein